MSRFDGLFGDPAVDPKLAEGLVRRSDNTAAGRSSALPTDGLYADIAAVQDSAADRVELAKRIGEALAAGDNASRSALDRNRRLDVRARRDDSAVQGQAREGRLATLKTGLRAWRWISSRILAVLNGALRRCAGSRRSGQAARARYCESRQRRHP
jgi:hypothetical protein